MWVESSLRWFHPPFLIESNYSAPTVPDAVHPERRMARGAPRLGHPCENIKTSLESKLSIRDF